LYFAERSPNLNGWRIATFVSFFGVLAAQLFHTLGLLLFWLLTAFGAGYGLQGLPKRAAKYTSS
jgi:hypothetical protein